MISPGSLLLKPICSE